MKQIKKKNHRLQSKTKQIQIFDTTLRDGSQAAGVSFTLDDKLKIARALDGLGVQYIEGGWPGSNPKDELFFKQIRQGKLKNAVVVAFGSTRHKDNRAAQDKNLAALVTARVKTACIFGKAWDLHVTHALRTTLDNNLKMIADSVLFLKSKGMDVIYDAEHFFDGYKANSAYAIKTLHAAAEAGACCISLCDTNGGMLPADVSDIVRVVRQELNSMPLGIHAHNDSECAVANSLIAVDEGCMMVQGTINGLGERCGNANLCSIIPALELKKKYQCLPTGAITTLTEVSRYVDEIANLMPNERQPYVGRNAFAHKAGIHVSAMARHSQTYEHMDPSGVGNERRILISELSGKSNVAFKARELALDVDKDPQAFSKIIESVKKAENQGYQFEDADASFALLTARALGVYQPLFALTSFRVSVEKNVHGQLVSEATIKIEVNGVEEHTVAEGDGPVNALDNSLRKALRKHYPAIKDITLSDFKVRVINAGQGTAAKVRVLIESKDARSTWGTIGVSENIIEASWQALVDAIEYKVLKESRR